MTVPTNTKDFLADMAAQAQTRPNIILPGVAGPDPIRDDTYWPGCEFKIVLCGRTHGGEIHEDFLLDHAQYYGLREQLQRDERRRRQEAEAVKE